MPHPIATRRVLYEIPGMDAMTPGEFEFPGSDGQPLAGRMYLPASPDPAPVVLIVEGYPDPGVVQHIGCRFMDMQWTISMAQLIAASGMAAITYANRQPAPDVAAIVEYLAAHASGPKIDASRMAFWATSGHGPVAISTVGRASCAVLWNPVTDPASAVPLPDCVALFVVRSGKDETPGLNDSLDRFVARALSQNQPMTLVNYPEGRHSFELYDSSEAARLILRQALEFLRVRLHT